MVISTMDKVQTVLFSELEKRGWLHAGSKNPVMVKNNCLFVYHKCELDTVKGSNLFIEIEREMLNDALWQLVRESLNYRDYQILYRYYKKEQSLKQIANDFNLTSEAIRKRKIRSLQKLKGNKYLQILAADYYGLQREVV